MRAAIHVKRMKVATRTASDKATSQADTPNGTRAIMMMGDVKGKMEAQNESALDGSCMVWMAM